MPNKVAVIGAGNVGAATARRIVEADLAEVVLVDPVPGRAQGKALDIAACAPLDGFTAAVSGTEEIAMTAGSDILVLTAGSPRKPGMGRDDLLQTNRRIVAEVTRQAAPLSPAAVIVCVANPLDAMTYVAYKESGFPAKRVVGMAGILDAARFRSFISEQLGVRASQVETMVLGGHGDAMVPLPRYTAIAGVPLTDRMDTETIDRLVARTRQGGAEVVKLMGTSAFESPAASIVAMVRAILEDEGRVLVCSAQLAGEYGISGIFLGVPVKLGREGVVEILKLDLTPEEQADLERSAAGVRRLQDDLDTLDK